MYKNLEQAMFFAKMNKKEVAQKSGIKYNSFLSKINGLSRFTLDETLDIREAINSKLSIEELFKKENDSKAH